LRFVIFVSGVFVCAAYVNLEVIISHGPV
jgi:hypothetical protein